ncbi:MAG: hypothetical protein U9R08_02225 [Nanoarchaeota archaeon]|nr:hypothetical protein [Nanoarchaeota archaeon]
MELKYDTFDYKVVANKIKKFLDINGISEVKLFFYDTEIDSEVFEIVKTSKIVDIILDIFDDEGQFFRFKIESLNSIFAYNSYEFSITFPDENESMFKLFKLGLE